jgi:hypothetical protein
MFSTNSGSCSWNKFSLGTYKFLQNSDFGIPWSAFIFTKKATFWNGYFSFWKSFLYSHSLKGYIIRHYFFIAITCCTFFNIFFFACNGLLLTRLFWFCTLCRHFINLTWHYIFIRICGR